MHETSRAVVEVRATDRVPVRVVFIDGKGRGVVAERDIRAGELVERAPVLILTEEHRRAVDQTSVADYIFMWEHRTTAEDLYTGKGRTALVLGFTSLLNHSSSPNCDFVRYIEAQALDLVATRNISRDEELTIDYGLTLWFDPA
jgi:SET domain-containing protein